MTNEERQIIADFIARVAGASGPQQQTPRGGASVPATAPSALPPIDREADAFIADQFSRYPEARYRLTQLAFVQEHALVEAQNRMKRLDWELQQAQQAAQQQQHGGGGFFSGLFGGGRSQTQPPGGTPPQWGQASQTGQPLPNYQPGSAPPQYPPNYNPGMFQRQGSGFLGSALTTAAGVAGGVLAADAIRDLFSPRQGLGGGFGSAAETASPWGASPPLDQGVPPDQGYVDQGTWDQGTDQGTWNDPSGGAGQDSGWDQGGGGNWDDQSSGGSDDDSLI
jgi:hypothetical protein